MREGPPRIVGLAGAGPELAAACRSALRDIASVREIEIDAETGQSSIEERLELILFRLMPPFDPAVRLLARCRAAQPGVPVILIGSNVPPDLAVELIKCGIADFISLPIEHVGLHRKVLRAFGEHHGPAFTWSMLSYFQNMDRAWSGRNRRHCFRVLTDLERPVKAHVVVDDVAYELSVLNLSIATEGWPGGLLLDASSEIADEIELDSMQNSGELSLSLVLPDDEGGAIELIGQPVAGLRPGPEGNVSFALQYWTKRPNEEPRIRRFWADAQRPTKQPPPGPGGQRSSRVSKVARTSRTSRTSRTHGRR